ncbi:MAG TPA: hypothetical protein VGK01_10440 [Candidatus Angelobacter sp.]|jgi:hypothetical protein
MLPNESYFKKARDAEDAAQRQTVSDSSMLMLLNEYVYLLRTVEPMRGLNRGILVGILALLALYPAISWPGRALLLSAGFITGIFWFVQASSVERKLNRLGELIAAANGKTSSDLRREPMPILTRPPGKELQADESRSQFIPSTQTGYSAPLLDDSWENIGVNTYVKWRHEQWKERKIQALQRFEPLCWILVMVGFYVYQIFAPYTRHYKS